MEDNRLASVAAALEALAAAEGGRPPEALTPAELAAVSEAFGVLKRRVEAAFAPVAAEIARQSRAELGGDSFARKQGFRTPASLISTTTGASRGETLRLMQVGEATAPRLSLTGEALPAKHPHVARAVAGGVMGMTVAAAIITMLDRIAVRVDPARLDDAERQLAELAAGMRPDEIGKLLARTEALLDPDGLEPAHEERRSRRALNLQERDGMLVLSATFDVETGAPIKAALDGLVAQVFRRNEQASEDVQDQRSARQLRADALADLCRHALGCDAVPTGPTTTVVVRMELSALADGVGAATLDGIDQPLPAAAVRRLAVEAQLIPCVLGGESEILDWGRAKRLFTPAQKLALLERDGGCARCGAPAAQAVAHHIRWWERDTGPTDLGNGVALCVPCHHAVHDDGWDIVVEGRGIAAKVWFIPPAWIDPSRTPRLGGRARYSLTARGSTPARVLGLGAGAACGVERRARRPASRPASDVASGARRRARISRRSRD